MKRAEIIFASVIITILVLVLAACSIFLLSEQQSCQLVSSKPLFELIKSNNIPSIDLKVLAKFTGFMEFKLRVLDNSNSDNQASDQLDKLYLPLELEAVGSYKSDEEETILVLTANCSTIMFTFEEKQESFKAKSALVNFPIVPSGMETSFCRLDNIEGVEFSASERYACYERRAYPCYQLNALGEKQIYGTFSINAIEFEINGDPEAHGTGRYSKSVNYCQNLSLNA